MPALEYVLPGHDVQSVEPLFENLPLGQVRKVGLLAAEFKGQ